MSSDKMYPLAIEELLAVVLAEFKEKQTIFGIPQSAFFSPAGHRELTLERYGQLLESPLGVAAGPQTQLAPNIIAAWLVGSRYIELKTVQVLDDLNVSKPCIDMEDEGFNCEWSQELAIEQSFNEYLSAWILIHVLKDLLYPGAKSKQLGTIFNMSVGYNMEGILSPKVQNFFRRMRDCRTEKDIAIAKIKSLYPRIEKLVIPDCISNNVTLSTMHGCPPDEIEKIGLYLISELKLHTTVKLNPTLNGPQTLRDLLNRQMGYENVEVPDIAFEHDLKYDDGLKIITNLRAKAKEVGVDFSLKLTNTLESVNNKNKFDKQSAEMMYMSGRGLHLVSIHLACKLQHHFKGELDVTFCAGVDAFNVADTLACNLKPITVCSDLLKPGGYGRLAQYFSNLQAAFKKAKATSIRDFVLKTAGVKNLAQATLQNLDAHFAKTLTNHRHHKSAFPWTNIKGKRQLTHFDCIKAPCEETCPASQPISAYMHLTEKGEYAHALELIRQSNPFPNTTGFACDHTCQDRCTRLNYDAPLRIREIKRFLAATENKTPTLKPKRKLEQRVAILGAGPSGLSAAFTLALEGFKVEIFEARTVAGGMISTVLPDFRTIKKRVDIDINRIRSLGVKVHEKTAINTPAKFKKLQDSFDYIYLSTGAALAKKMNIAGEEGKGVIDFLTFLMNVKLKKLTTLAGQTLIIGGGNSAIDAARTAARLVGDPTRVEMIYRRTIREMPANHEEIEELLEEKIAVRELTLPVAVLRDARGHLTGLQCQKMELGELDAKGRRQPVAIAGSEFVIPCANIIVAIGQEVDASFFEKGLVSSVSTQTQVTPSAQIYAGGDLVRGPHSIIAAIADGQRAATAIALRHGLTPSLSTDAVATNLTLEEIRAKRRLRVDSVTLKRSPLSKRKNFDLVIQGLAEKEAKLEAARCLHCDEVCEVCVTVCPNRANISYQTVTFTADLREIEIKNGQIHERVVAPFSIQQRFQTLNFGDLCNECGNCATFCPTNGRPYLDKFKFYRSFAGYSTSAKKVIFCKKDSVQGISFLAKLSDGCEISQSVDARGCEILSTPYWDGEIERDGYRISQVTRVKQDGCLDMRELAEVIFLIRVLRSDLRYLTA